MLLPLSVPVCVDVDGDVDADADDVGACVDADVVADVICACVDADDDVGIGSSGDTNSVVDGDPSSCGGGR